MPTPIFHRIGDYLDHHAAAQPDAEAVVGTDVRLCWRDLANRVDAYACGLLAAGVGPGGRVALLAPPSPDYWLCFLAAARIGAIFVGLNPRHRLAELRHVLTDCTPRLLLTRKALDGRDHAGELAALCGELPVPPRLVVLDDSAAFLAAGDGLPVGALSAATTRVSPDDIALIVYTSGSTGKPKGAMLRHRGLMTCARVQDRHIGLSCPRLINNLPINHIGCSGDLGCYALVAGGTQVFMENFDPAGLLAIIAAERISLWAQVPTMFQLAVQRPEFSRTDLSSLRVVFWSGAAMPADLVRLFAGLGVRLLTSYGMTETTGSVTWSAPDADIDSLSHTVGRPESSYEFRIADGHGQPCPPGLSGEVQVRGDWLMAGYFNNPDASAAAFTEDGWLHSGDVGLMQADGNVRLVGRMREMFKSGGYNIYPREVELVLEEHPAVAMAAVLGVPDPVWQEVGHAFVRRQPGRAAGEAELTAFCRDRLANYKIPKRITILDDLPMLPIGKIDKQALRASLTVATLAAVPEPGEG